MQRTGLLIVVALVIVAAIAGLLTYTNFLPSNPSTSTSSDTGAQSAGASAPAPSPEAQLVAQMQAAATGNGFAATFLEADVSKWRIADGFKIERFSLGADGPAFGRLSSSTPLDEKSVNWPTLGLSALLPVEFAQAANGQRIQVGIIARASQSSASQSISVLYATQQAGNTGWRKFELQPNFQLFKFVYDIPEVEGGYDATPIVVINSDATGSGQSSEILGVYVKIVKKE
jgi:hypothetical protein